jgi:DNA-binding beta-propeller fold protein YncE
MIYATSPSKNALNVINGYINQVVSVVPAGSGPWYVSVNPKTHMVYVADNNSGDVKVINGNVLPIMVATGIK